MSLLDNVPGAPSLGSYDSRRIEAKFVSPDKKESFTFIYEGELAEEITRKGSINEFPDIDGGYALQLGRGANTYPVVMHFSGAAHDVDSEEAVKILNYHGHGFLHHPLFGIKRVAIIGTIKRYTDTVEDASCSKIETTFTETLPELFPTGKDPIEGETATLFNASMVSASKSFEGVWDVTDPSDGLTAIESVQGALRDVQRTIGKVTQGINELESEITRDTNLINLTIDSLLGAPANLFAAVYGVVTAPARSLDASKRRAQVYADQMIYLIGLFREYVRWTSVKSPPNGSNTAKKNELALDAAVISIQLGSMSLAMTAHKFASQQDAKAAVADFMAGYMEAVMWKDQMEALEEYGMAGAYDWKELSALVAAAAGEVVRNAFDLANQKDYVTQSPENVLTLAWSLYGEKDSKVDELLTLNELSASDILLINQGKAIQYLGK